MTASTIDPEIARSWLLVSGTDLSASTRPPSRAPTRSSSTSRTPSTRSESPRARDVGHRLARPAAAALGAHQRPLQRVLVGRRRRPEGRARASRASCSPRPRRPSTSPRPSTASAEPCRCWPWSSRRSASRRRRRSRAPAARSGSAFGSGDYRRDTGTSADDLAMAYPRSRLVVASRIGNLPGPIDGPTVGSQPPRAARAVGDRGGPRPDRQALPRRRAAAGDQRGHQPHRVGCDVGARLPRRLRGARPGHPRRQRPARLGRAQKIDRLAQAFGIVPIARR